MCVCVCVCVEMVNSGKSEKIEKYEKMLINQNIQ